MLREALFQHHNFRVNRLVKAYIVSESLMWSAWNFIIPIFAVFIVEHIENATIQTAAAGYSIYLISRVGFELLSGKMLASSTDRTKAKMVIIGMMVVSLSYLGFAFVTNIFTLFAFYFISGLGIGLTAPAKNALFAMHLDKAKEATEWGVSDAFQFFSMAIATTLGGFIALHFGFRSLFILAFICNCLAIGPYFFYLHPKNRKQVSS